MTQRIRNLYGWFDDAEQSGPAYDPPHDAPCPHCGEPLRPTDVRTESLMLAAGARRSYFFRVHRTCDDAATQATRDTITDGVIRRIEMELGGV